MRYAPGFLPLSADGLPEAVRIELQKVQDAIQQIHLHETEYIEPTRPQSGQVVYADGTNWNPGAGEGIYAYYNNRWNPLMTIDYALEVAKGNIPGTTVVNKFGRNVDIDTAADEDIWDAGGDWTAPTAARTHDVVSTNSADNASGTGARTIEVQGLDANWAEQTETLSLHASDGTIAVSTANTYTRIFRMKVLTAGSGGANAGDITATAQTDATVTAQISAGFNQTLMAIYTVPAGKTLYVPKYYLAMNGLTTTGAADIALYVRDAETPGPWLVKSLLGTVGAGTSYLERNFEPYLTLSAKQDVRVRASVSANNTDISAGFDGYLVAD